MCQCDQDSTRCFLLSLNASLLEKVLFVHLQTNKGFLLQNVCCYLLNSLAAAHWKRLHLVCFTMGTAISFHCEGDNRLKHRDAFLCLPGEPKYIGWFFRIPFLTISQFCISKFYSSANFLGFWFLSVYVLNFCFPHSFSLFPYSLFLLLLFSK